MSKTKVFAEEMINYAKFPEIEKIKLLEAENAKLRAVVDAARGVFLGEGEHLCSEFKNVIDRLRQALAELDKEGERCERLNLGAKG